jgi:positive regulator of sigma E activity
MSDQGFVIETRTNGTALVEITVRSGDCGSCDLCASSTNPRLIAANPLAAGIGDTVEVEPRKPGLGGSALVFIVPLAVFLIFGGGTFMLLRRSPAAGFAELLSAGIGLGMMFLWFVVLRLFQPKKPGAGLSRIVRIIRSNR